MHPFDCVRRRPGDGSWGRFLRYLPVTTSTNDEAHRAAAEGAPDGFLVVADEQTQGRGRHGRSWSAPPGQNLLASWVVRPTVGPDRWSWIPLAAALAVVDVVEAAVPASDVRVKWPNDVRLGGKKVSGILAESRLDAGGAGHVVLGIGLNVNQAGFPAELESTATSLFLAAGVGRDRATVLSDLCDALERRVTSIDRPGNGLLVDYRARLDGVGQRARLHRPGARDVVEGRMLDVDEQGALVLDVDGEARTFRAGEVTFRPA